MRRLIDNSMLILALRIVMAGIFLWAAQSKIIEPSGFAKAVSNYHILPGALVNIFALTLPWVEVFVAFGLLFGVWRHSSALLLNLMLVVFTVALLIAISKGVDIDCGCFTQNPDVKSSLWEAFARDLGFLALALPLLFTRARGFLWG